MTLRMMVALMVVLMVSMTARAGLVCPTVTTVERGEHGGVRHGRALALDWNVAVTGDYSFDSYRGCAYISRFLGGEWEDTVVVEGLGAAEEFGVGVATSEYYVLVGVGNTPDGLGAVDVFTLDGGTWERVSSIPPPTGWALQPWVMAMSGGWVAIAAQEEATGYGGVALYLRSGDTFSHEETIESGGVTGARIDLSGSTLVIGWPGLEVVVDDESGAVEMYRFISGGEGGWQWQWGIWGATGTNTGAYVATDGRDAVCSTGGFYESMEGDQSRLMFLPQNGNVYYSTWFDCGVMSQITDLGFNDGVVAASIWVAGGVNSTVLLDANTAAKLPFTDSEDTAGRRYQVAIDDGSVLYDYNTLPNDDLGREVRFGPVHDCDGNGLMDACDVGGTNSDLDGDGRFDWCVCPGNINPHVDSVIDDADLFGVLYLYWGDATGYGDCDGDSLCGVRDLLIILENWGSCS